MRDSTSQALGGRQVRGGVGTSLLGLGLALLLLYWPVATARASFFVGDIFRLGYPARHEYALGLAKGNVPLWTPNALAGYPVLAEGQTGAYYPPNLLLHSLLPVVPAMNYGILFALWLAGVGMVFYVRSLGVRPVAAFGAACAFMLGGFLPGHLNHLNMLAAVAWLPWLLWAVEEATRRPAPWRYGLIAVFFGVQGLAGHPQVSLLSALIVAPYAALGPLGSLHPLSWRRQLGQVACCGVALAGGAALAAVQWLPTYELTRLSQRGQGLDPEFFTSFSLSPAHYITMLWPFLRGNPYPLTSLETIGYVGILPLLLAATVPLRRRDRATRCWAGVALLGVALSLGRWNPLYRLLMYVPVFNMFRAPARYLLWVDLAVAVLAAMGFDSLLPEERDATAGRRFRVPAEGVALIGLGGWWLGRVDLDSLLVVWRWLPLALLILGCGLLVAVRWRPQPRLWAGLCLGLLLADLWAFNGVYNQTYNAVVAPAEMEGAPRVLELLEQDADDRMYRVLTSEEILPVLSVMRESLYPNIQLLHGVQSVNGYYPLMSGPQRWLWNNLNPRLLNLLGVRYILVPQLLPVDEATELYDTTDPFAPPVVGRAFDLPAVLVAELEVEGYLSHSADLEDGTPVCEVVLRGAAGRQEIWTLRAGDELAEWAFLRDDVRLVVKHRLPAQIARRWQGRSGFPPRDHQALTFLARRRLDTAMAVEQIEVRPLVPSAYVHVERVRLFGEDGAGRLLSEIVGEGDHVLILRTPEVAVFRNEHAGPRAFLVHRARVARDEEEAQRWTAAPDLRPQEEVILLEGMPMDGSPLQDDRVSIVDYAAERVVLRTQSAAAGYLVLADSYYPGWIATVDGQAAQVLRADVALRAVQLGAGDHEVVFEFRPSSHRLGALASSVALAGIVGLMATSVVRWRVGRRRAP
ncbi:MAG: YfhO family protein [Anaerolineae bacterium]